MKRKSDHIQEDVQHSKRSTNRSLREQTMTFTATHRMAKQFALYDTSMFFFAIRAGIRGTVQESGN